MSLAGGAGLVFATMLSSSPEVGGDSSRFRRGIYGRTGLHSRRPAQGSQGTCPPRKSPGPRGQKWSSPFLAPIAHEAQAAAAPGTTGLHAPPPGKGRMSSGARMADFREVGVSGRPAVQEARGLEARAPRRSAAPGRPGLNGVAEQKLLSARECVTCFAGPRRSVAGSA